MIPDFLSDKNTRFFSLARFALLEALNTCDFKAGDIALIPELICRDVLAPLNLKQAKIIFYPVNQQLNPIGLQSLPAAKIILAVNYFGFPQDLKVFKDYQRQHPGCSLIEDNAHGFLSRTNDGVWLGTRADLGIFSLRKTLALPQGAALVSVKTSPSSQLPSIQVSSMNLKIKTFLRNIHPRLELGMAQILRGWRKLRSGYEFPESGSALESEIPGPPNPSTQVAHLAQIFSLAKESERRRHLFIQIKELLKTSECKPIFNDLEIGTVPYTYPFYADKNQQPQVEALLNRHGFESFAWPEMPSSDQTPSEHFYHHIRCVRFL